MNNMIADTKDYHQRIQQGKQIEFKIITALRKNGINIADATSREDMFDKIDGWIINKLGERQSVQIKYRENGNDIIFELVKDLYRGIPGRDMNCKAENYLLVNSQGVGKLFKTHEIKYMASIILNYVKSQMETMIHRQTKWNSEENKWEAKITVDKAEGQCKLMAYMNPSMFTTIGEWKNLI